MCPLLSDSLLVRELPAASYFIHIVTGCSFLLPACGLAKCSNLIFLLPDCLVIIGANISIGCSFCAYVYVCVFFSKLFWVENIESTLLFFWFFSVTLFAYLNRWFPFSGITELVNNVLQPQQKQQNEKEPQT